MFDEHCRLVPSQYHTNDKGSIHVYENENLPFIPVRMFWITNVPKLAKRGGHAHKVGQQFIVCVNGAVEINIHGEEESIHINQDSLHGLYLPPMKWIDIRFLRPKSKIVVLCSNWYNENDYIRSKDEFIKLQDSIQRSQTSTSGPEIKN